MAERQSQYDHLNATHYPQPTQPLAGVSARVAGEVPATLPGGSADIESGRRVNVMKWSLGCAGLGMMGISGSIIAFLIVMPLLYRSLPAAQRDSIGNRIPFMRRFEPTLVISSWTALPTFASTSAGAIALLQTSVSTPTPPAPVA